MEVCLSASCRYNVSLNNLLPHCQNRQNLRLRARERRDGQKFNTIYPHFTGYQTTLYHCSSIFSLYDGLWMLRGFGSDLEETFLQVQPSPPCSSPNQSVTHRRWRSSVPSLVSCVYFLFFSCMERSRPCESKQVDTSERDKRGIAQLRLLNHPLCRCHSSSSSYICFTSFS